VPGFVRQRGTVLLFMLLVSLSYASCKLGGNSGLDEATNLNQSAGADVDEIEKIIQENKGKEIDITRALDAEDYETAKKEMNDVISAIDRGLERGQSAAEKFDKASKLDIDPTIKEYLSYRAQSVNKAVEAFKELRKGIVAFRDAAGSKDKAVSEKAKNDVQQASQTFDSLISEAQRLEDKADDIARRNPDKEVFMVFGGERYRESMKKYDIPANLKLQFALSQDEVFQLMNSAKVYWSSSRFDTFAMPLTEALAMGKIVVKPEHPCYDHISSAHSFAGNERNWFELVNMAVSSPRRFSQENRDYAFETFSASIMKEGYRQFYSDWLK